MTAFGNILRQVLCRRRRGSRSVIAGLALAPLWQLYKRTVAMPIVVKTWRGTRLVLEADCVTSSRFVYEGRPDEELIETLAAFADDDACFVDVGANVGLYTVLLSGDFARGWAFEPNPVAARRLRRNIAMNDAVARFEVVEAAVSDCPGRMPFPDIARPDPTASLAGTAVGPAITVPVVTLDRALPADLAYVVKIDAEGWDARVLRGARDHLGNGRIRLALFECTAPAALGDVLKLADGFGYAVYGGQRRIEGPQTAYGQNLFLVRGDLVARYLDVVPPMREAS